MDAFITEFMLHRLGDQIKQNKTSADAHLDLLDTEFTALQARVSGLEGVGITVDGAINTLRNQFTDLTKFSSTLLGEINKMKSMTLKQDMSIRTLHNLALYKADDIYVDTFVTADNIDMTLSIRPEWITELQAVGKTRSSLISAQQPYTTSAMLVSMNGSSDNAVSQTFILDKDRRIDKVSLFLTKFSASTSLPLTVSIRATQDGEDVVSISIPANEVMGDWMDVHFPDYLLTGGQNYYLNIRTDDLYGYKVAMDPTDKYMAGTSYSRFVTTWTENGHDISFKVWCFPTDDENNATIYTKTTTYATRPISIIFEKQDFLENGTINYYVSRDNGVNWKLLQPGVPTDLEDMPVGKDLVLKAYITGPCYIESWSYVIVRGDS